MLLTASRMTSRVGPRSGVDLFSSRVNVHCGCRTCSCCSADCATLAQSSSVRRVLAPSVEMAYQYVSCSRNSSALGEAASNFSTSLCLACNMESRSSSLALKLSSCSCVGSSLLTSRRRRPRSSARIETSGNGMAVGGCASAGGAGAVWLGCAWLLPSSAPIGLTLWATEDGLTQNATSKRKSTRTEGEKCTTRQPLPEPSPGGRADGKDNSMRSPIIADGRDFQPVLDRFLAAAHGDEHVAVTITLFPAEC